MKELPLVLDIFLKSSSEDIFSLLLRGKKGERDREEEAGRDGGGGGAGPHRLVAFLCVA